ncbi:MAG TPA: response regulator [Ignavibacteriaceae bacterium]|nr:response regulator [Ignavibacteriaceae bacterium]
MNILIAEDERIITLDLKKSLAEMGYKTVHSVHTASDAVNYALEFKPDIILMDIKFEDSINGIEAAYFINSRIGTPVVFISAFSPESFIKNKKIPENFSYVRKPINADELSSKIKEVLSVPPKNKAFSEIKT